MKSFAYYGLWDSLYLFLVLPAILIAVLCQFWVKFTFSKYTALHCRMTGAEAARRVLTANGITDVAIEKTAGSLTDHYDPSTRVIRLSESVYDAANAAAIGVAAHEAGHAVQFANGYLPIRLRAVVLPVCNLGSQLSLPLLIVGLIFNLHLLVNLGVIFFSVALLFQLVTLPIEFNASRLAVRVLANEQLLTDEAHLKAVRRVLSAAAATYVAAFWVSLMQLFRLLAISRRKR